MNYIIIIIIIINAVLYNCERGTEGGIRVETLINNL